MTMQYATPQFLSGTLEIDHKRGVIYFHAAPHQHVSPTPLRICSLPKPIPPVTENFSLDVTHMTGAGWLPEKPPTQKHLTLSGLDVEVLVCALRNEAYTNESRTDAHASTREMIFRSLLRRLEVLR